jgi:dolichol kinase
MANPLIELIWSIFIFLVLLGTSGLLYVIAYWGFKKRNMYSGFSTVSSAILITFFAIYELQQNLFPWPYGPFFFIIVVIVIMIHLLVWAIKKKKLTHSGSSTDPSYENANHNFSLKQEYLRKSFHLAGILLPIGYFWVFPWINNLILKIITTIRGQVLYELLWGEFSNYPYTMNDPMASGELIYFVLWCALMFMLVFDFIRIFSKSEYTMFHRLLKTVLREKEYFSVGPQVLLVLGAVFSFFLATLGLFSYEIAVSATFSACIADGLVAVLGRTFGKHKVSVFGEVKSIEGFIIGFLSAYLCSMIIIGPVYAVFAAIIFVLIDIFTIPIADNLLNPILLSLVVWGASLILKFPIGWGF